MMSLTSLAGVVLALTPQELPPNLMSLSLPRVEGEAVVSDRMLPSWVKMMVRLVKE